jgi:hypothetical protein
MKIKFYRRQIGNKLLKFILKNEGRLKYILRFIPLDLNKKKYLCIGLPRSGTHSMERILKSEFGLNGRHEPQAIVILDYIVNDFKEEHGKNAEQFIILREKLFRYQFESSYYQIFLVPYFVKLFPNSFYILTIRNPIDWVNSMMNFAIRKNYKINDLWGKYICKIAGDIEVIGRQEKDLKETLTLHYLKYYKMHIDLALKNIPKEQLLIMDTYEINDSFDEIAKFIKVALV